MVQAFTFVLVGILVGIVLLQSLLRPQLLYTGHRSAKVAPLTTTCSLVAKVISRLMFLPVMQVRRPGFVCSYWPVGACLRPLARGCLPPTLDHRGLLA